MLTTTVVPLRYLYLLEKQGNHESLSESDFRETNEDRFVIKIPIALPYSSDWDSPKAAEGLIERNGEFFTIVSKNYVNDTLYVECVQNNNAKEIFNSLSDHLENFSDFSGDHDKNKSSGLDILKLLTQSFFPLSCQSPSFESTLESLGNKRLFLVFSWYLPPGLHLETPPPQISIS